MAIWFFCCIVMIIGWVVPPCGGLWLAYLLINRRLVAVLHLFAKCDDVKHALVLCLADSFKHAPRRGVDGGDSPELVVIGCLTRREGLGGALAVEG